MDMTILISALAVVGVVGFVISRGNKSLEEREAAALRGFLREAAAEGIDPGAALSERRVRLGFVRLRREASQLVMRDPDQADEIIVKVAKSIALEMAVASKAEARAFIKWVEKEPRYEILYPEAFNAWVRHIATPTQTLPARSSQDIADNIAAMGVRL